MSAEEVIRELIRFANAHTISIYAPNDKAPDLACGLPSEASFLAILAIAAPPFFDRTSGQRLLSSHPCFVNSC